MWVTTKYHAAIYFAVTKTWRRFFLISRRLHRYSDNRRWPGGSRRLLRRKLPWTTWRGRIRWSRIRWQVGSCTNITWLLVLVAGPRTNQNFEYEAGRAAGGAPDQRGHGGERHLLPQRQTVRGEVVIRIIQSVVNINTFVRDFLVLTWSRLLVNQFVHRERI